MVAINGEIVILIADDDPDDQMFIREAFEDLGLECSLKFAVDGQDLLDYLHHDCAWVDPKASPRPHLILLDLNMPRVDGREALRQIKANPELKNIPVVMFTTSKHDVDILQCYRAHANSYVTKPTTFEGLMKFVEVLTRYWLDVVSLPEMSENISQAAIEAHGAPAAAPQSFVG